MTQSEGLNGDPSLVASERALTELRRGRAIAISHSLREEPLLVAALETADAGLLGKLRASSALPLVLALTAERGQALGLQTVAGQPLMLQLDPAMSDVAIANLSHDWLAGHWRTALAGATALAASPDRRSAVALQLAKRARLLPALILATPRLQPQGHDVLGVRVADLERFEALQGDDLLRVSEARVPLKDCEDSRLVLFRERRDGTEHVAVMVGQPDISLPVPLRLHSACLTGDLLGSLRCDCGEQLSSAVERLAAAGGGLLLYLAQEGRGIGLANKLRAYQLQDSGFDTIDADLQLGFTADERTYDVAAAMLRQLNIPAVRMLTNSPQKVRALREAGITVADVGALAPTPNPHNVRYIRTKQQRAGHFHAGAEEPT